MNPQIGKFIEMLKATIPADTPKMWQLTPAQAREQSERFFAPFNAGGPQMARCATSRSPAGAAAFRRGSMSRATRLPCRLDYCTCTAADRQLALARRIRDRQPLDA